MAEPERRGRAREAVAQVVKLLEGPPIDDLAELRQAVEEKRGVALAGGSKKLRFESLEETCDGPRLNVTLIVPLDEFTITIGLDEEAKCPKP